MQRGPIGMVMLAAGMLGCGDDAKVAADGEVGVEAEGEVGAEADVEGEGEAEVEAEVEVESEVDVGPDVSDPVHWASVRQVGGAMDDEATDVLALADGSVLVAGYEGGTLGVSNVQPAGNAQAWVRRFDVSGALSQTWRLETSGTDVAEGLAVGTDGAVFVVGRTSGDFGTNAGGFDLFIARLLPDGSIARVDQFGDERGQHPRRIADGGSGSLFVIGWDDEYIAHQQLIDSENGFTASYRYAAGAFFEEGRQRAQAAFNPDRLGALAVGHGAAFTGGFRFNEDDEGPAGAFVECAPLAVATDAVPVPPVQPWRTFLSVAGTQPTALVVTSDRVYVAGSTVFPFDPAMDGLGDVDAFVAALDLNGTLLWARRYGTSTADLVSGMALAPDGSLVLSGTTHGDLGGASAGGSDVFVLTVDLAGEVIGTWQDGTASDDVASAISIDPSGRIFIAGGTTGAMVAGQSNAGRVDAFVREIVLEK